jgi:hypothetical protein
LFDTLLNEKANEDEGEKKKNAEGSVMHPTRVLMLRWSDKKTKTKTKERT